MFGIDSWIITIIIIAWVILVGATNYFILSSLICMLFIPVLMYLFKLSNTFVIFGILYFLAGLFTHRHDVVRIFSGREKKALSSIKKYFGV
jgi:glycerol-3-phosphate acyltransferase PlsY